MANECVAYYEDAERITVECTGAVVGKRFVTISADKRAGSLALSADALGGNIRVAQSVAGDRALGVADRDCPSGGRVGIYVHSAIVPVTAGAAITAGQEVQADATGRAIPLAAGKALGIAVFAQATVNNDVGVRLY